MVSHPLVAVEILYLPCISPRPPYISPHLPYISTRRPDGLAPPRGGGDPLSPLYLPTSPISPHNSPISPPGGLMVSHPLVAVEILYLPCISPCLPNISPHLHQAA
jgi:hypothetical protein